MEDFFLRKNTNFAASLAVFDHKSSILSVQSDNDAEKATVVLCAVSMWSFQGFSTKMAD